MKKKSSFLFYTLIISIMLLAPSIFAGISHNQGPTVNKAISYTSISSITDFSKYGTDYGYNSLASKDRGSQMQELYNLYVDAAIEFWNSTEDLTETIEINGTTYYVIKRIDLLTYSVNEVDITETYVSFKNDNPIFYFASSSLEVSGGTVAFLTNADYKSASVRNECKSDIIAGLNKMGTMINGKSSSFDIILTLHDMINNDIYYAYKSDGTTPEDTAWAHNIMGYFDDTIKKGVCECYARTLQLGMNMAGIDNMIVTGRVLDTGEEHAWNLAKFDDGNYYHIDATWNDDESSFNYFGIGTSITSNRFIYDSSYSGVNFIYNLPSVPSTNYKPTVSGTITLKSADDFKWFQLAPSGSYVLAANIDFSNMVSCNNGKSYYDIVFTGSLDGKNYTISGLKTALFGEIGSGGKVTNLKTNADFNGSSWNNVSDICPQYKTTIAYTNNGTIDKCETTYKVSDSTGRELQTVFCTGAAVYNYGTISNCTANINAASFKSSVTEFLDISGIAYENYGSISKCMGNIAVSGTGSNTRIDVSGIAYANMENGVIDGCTSAGSLTGSTPGHAALNGICSNNMYGTIKNCTNDADANICTGGLMYSGGICGINNSLIENCTNNGDITNNYSDYMVYVSAAIGGIAGSSGPGAVIKDCTNNGSLTTDIDGAGGILGSAWRDTTIESCINKGKISGTENTSGVSRRGSKAGGIVGSVDLDIYNEGTDGSMNMTSGKVIITDCTNEALVYSYFGSGFAGCIVSSISIADAKSSVEITDCTSTGIAYFNKRYQNIIYGYYYNNATGTSRQNGESIPDANYATSGCDTSKTTFTDEIGGNSGGGNSGGGNSGGNSGGGSSGGGSSSGNNDSSNDATSETTTDNSETTTETPSDTESDTTTDSNTSNDDDEDNTTNNQANDKEEADNSTKKTNDDNNSLSPVIIVLIIILALAILGGGGAALYIFVIKKKSITEDNTDEE